MLTERNAVAGELAENQLNEILVDGSSGSTTDTGGEFGANWPGYRYETSEQLWDQDNTMTQLSVEVFFKVQGQEHSVRLTTLLSGSEQGTTGQ